MQQLCMAVENADLPETLGEFVRLAAEQYGSQWAANWFDDGDRISYADLDDKANRLASALLGMGVRKGAHVAVMLGNVAAFPITWVALGRIGAVMVPVNTAYKINDLGFILADSDAQFFIVADEFLPLFDEIQGALPLLAPERIIVYGQPGPGHQDWTQLVAAGDPSFESPFLVSRTDLLNIQYTSGTTGFPKGCMLSHDYWMLITHFAAAPHRQGKDIENLLIWQPFFYMDGMWLLLLSMKLGATAYIARSMRMRSFYDWLERYKINYCIFPEAALKARAPCEQDRNLALSYISIYGWSHASRLEAKERFGVRAREGYGMTEIGLALVVPNSAEIRSLDKTCGLPGPFRKLRIVDENGADVPDGQTGELWVSGRSILWGYYKRPKENAASFDNGWFKTGDIFYRDPAGYHYLVGRSKDMIKRAGENIAAREVEATLCGLEHVAEAAVVGVPDLKRREEVKAYILLRDGYTPDDCPPDVIIAHCKRLLAAFKVPRYITYVNEFPRTPSRKIRKQEMIALDDKLQLRTYDKEAARVQAS